jgi:hypothetical protein
VETYVFGALGADGLEGPQADVEGDAGDLDAAGFEGAENFWSEVEAGGRGGGGACDRIGALLVEGCGVDRLVAVVAFSRWM